MKSLRFKSLQLLSEATKKARQITFHPNRNLFLGMNRVGKSTITKQIFEALGATPAGKLEFWDKRSIALLKIELDGQQFQVLRQLNNRALLDESGNILFCASRAGEWAKLFCDFIGFNLVLTDKSEKTVNADASSLFLPFYINQDGGWSAIWKPFNGLSRFKNGPKSTIEYFTQILPPHYYIAKAAFEIEQREIIALDGEQRILNRTRDRLSEALDIVGPRLSAQEFEVEIKDISRQLTLLNEKQEKLRLEALRLEDALGSTTRQIALTRDALRKSGEDFRYLTEPNHSEMTCPTCGAQHEESFLEILNYSEDTRQLSDMLIRLEALQQQLLNQLSMTRAERETLAVQYEELQSTLEVKRGDLKFEDVVRSAGSGAAFAAFDGEDARMEKLRNVHLTARHKFQQEMDSLKNPKRRKAIKKAFQEHYEIARRKLNLPARDIRKMQVFSRPDYSGSDGPREILAYYAALWWVSQTDFGSPFSIPIIVDCPMQSGQDIKNLPAMIEFVSGGLPPDSQVIMTYEADVPQEFDSRTVLTEEYGLLNTHDFEMLNVSIFETMSLLHKRLLQDASIKAATA